MVVNDGICDHAFIKDGLIEVIDLIRAQACNGNGFCAEVPLDPAVDHVVITAVGVDLQAWLNTAEPFDHVIEDGHIGFRGL